MVDRYEYYSDLVKRTKDAFMEIDSDITTELRKSDEGYAALFRESATLQEQYPALEQVLEGKGAIKLIPDEHAALVRYMSLREEMEKAERQHIYFRGHTDSFAYLKEIGAI